jgi:hypothetical protein
MESMFTNAHAFNQPNGSWNTIGSWATSNVHKTDRTVAKAHSAYLEQPQQCVEPQQCVALLC